MYPQNIGPGTRFFFFNSLKRSAEINEEAAATLEAAESIIFGGPNKLDEKVQQASILNAINNSITFLENMANFEAENERKVFEQQLMPLTNDPKYSKFKEIYQEDNINYPLLLTFINILNQDIDEMKVLFQDLKQTTTNFNKAAKKIIQGKKYDYTEIQRHRGQLTTEARTLANEMGLKINSEVSEIGASLIRDISSSQKQIEEQGRELIEQNIISMLQNNQTKLILNSNQKTGLISILMSKLREIAALNTEQKGTQTKLKSLLEEIYSSKDKEKQITEELMKEAENSLKQLDFVETRGQQIERILNRGQKEIRLQNGRVIGLTKKNREKLNKFLQNQSKNKINLEQLVHQNKGAEQSTNILNKETNELYIQKLQEKLDMQNSSLEDLISEINQILQQVNQSTRKESITIMTESQSAGKLIALLSDETIKGAVLDAMINGKNDASFVFLGRAFYDSGLDQNFGEVLTAELQNFQKIQSPILKELGEKNTNTSFNAEAQTLAVEKMDENFINDIAAELGEQQLTIEQIKDIFVLDSSVKFAETFIADEGGFKGGSLGSDVESQIKNINYMLELGGITPLDAEWLLTATLNAGSGMIGSSQRNALENYFSTAAAMLMFRTGGNTIKQWSDQIKNDISKAPTRIHIYTFGTLFVPQSYILKLTAEGLKKCTNLLISEADSSGSRAHIYNPVSSANIVKNNWEQTSEDNYKNVQIQLTLLGGFLDILHQMEDIMNSLPF